MKPLPIVTTNEDKYNEIAKILNNNGIKTNQKKIELSETGDTLEEVAKGKAKDAYRKVKKPLIVEDTGIFFTAYRNFPGLFAKRMYIALGFSGLMKLLKGRSRKAYFKTVICYYNGKKMKIFTGRLEGTIGKKIQARHNRAKLPYERIFSPIGTKNTLSQISVKEKNKISHRAKATKKFARWFKG